MEIDVVDNISTNLLLFFAFIFTLLKSDKALLPKALNIL